MNKRRISLIVLFFVLVSATVLTVVRWQAWFGLPAESPFALDKGIHRVFVVPGGDGLRSRVVTWVSGDSLPMAFIFDGDTTLISPKRIPTEGGVTYTFRKGLQDLFVGTHRYRITTRSGETFADSLFVRGISRRDRLIYIGDIQDREKGLSRNFLGGVAKRYPDADAWLFAGDLIERGHNGYWEIFYDAVGDFAPHTVFVPAPGNHEYTKGFSRKPDPRWREAFPKPLTSDGQDDEEGGYNYFVDYPYARVVVIDTNTLPFGNLFPLTSWLKRTLTEREDDPFLIIVMHHGVHSMASGRVNLAERFVLGPLFETQGVDLVLQGHDHVYARVKKEDASDPLYITSTTSLKSYEVKPDPSWLDASADGGRFYVVLDIDAEKIDGTTFRENHSGFDRFTITKHR